MLTVDVADILVNNAGGGSSSTENAGTIEEEDATSWDCLVDSNVKTAFLCTRANFERVGARVALSASPGQFAEELREERAHWERIVADLDLVVD